MKKFWTVVPRKISAINLKNFVFDMNFRILISFVMAVITFVVSIFGTVKLKKISFDDNETYIESEKTFDHLLDCQKSDGVYTGLLYTIDGEAMTIMKESEDNAPYTEATSQAYEMLRKEIEDENNSVCQNILFSGSLQDNRVLLKGNDIQTTIHSKGQKVAYEEVYSYVNNDSGANITAAQIAVVLPDGAVLVYARYGEPTINPQAGSSAKALFSRIYSSEEFRDGSEYDIGNIFTDHNIAVDNGRVIHNHNGNIEEFDVPSIYPEYHGIVTEMVKENEVLVEKIHQDYSRKIDLNLALIDSSNYYFIEHANHFGREKVIDALNKSFFFNYALTIDILNTIPPVTNDDTKNSVDFFYGQGLNITPIRLCATMNAATTGDFYVPFFAARVVTPSKSVLYQNDPEANKHSTGIEVNRENDIVIPALKECYSYKSYNENNPLLTKYNGRIMAKSGTADDYSGGDTRTMLISVFDSSEEQNLLCSAICVTERSKIESYPQNDALLLSLVKVLEEIGILK